jgi:hypothetical protein
MSRLREASGHLVEHSDRLVDILVVEAHEPLDQLDTWVVLSDTQSPVLGPVIERDLDPVQRESLASYRDDLYEAEGRPADSEVEKGEQLLDPSITVNGWHPDQGAVVLTYEVRCQQGSQL